MMRASARSGPMVGALLALLALVGCDSFPAVCGPGNPCGERQLCQSGECVEVDPALLAQCEDAAEVCNTRDDDCDGVADEGCEAGQPCIAGLGLCAREGLLAASPRGLLCSADPGPPADEACNTLDDDCDGAVDESCRAGAPCFTGVGQCRSDGRVEIRERRRVCVVDGALVEPGAPSDEVCGDRVDNDCDGEIDEGFAERLGQPCSDGQGVCAVTGVTVCFEGRVQCSATPGQPQAEVCDRRDDDCDGAVDEDFGTGMACTAGVGACQSSGMTICNGTQDGVSCNAVPQPPGEEVCNGVDDDCDGGVDEGAPGEPLAQACGSDTGECREGVERCVDARWGACEGGQGAISEVCNGRDDDCDGTPDQFDRPCGSNTGRCVAGSERCIDGLWGACIGATLARDETCDGTDDDCDETVDEADGTGVPGSYSEPCGLTDVGECAFGVRLCVDGALEPCVGEIRPVEEACNGLDDDCDGEVDNGYARLGDPCAVVLDDGCRLSGVFICEAGGGGTLCSVEVEDPPEQCNDVDDDCDGVVDEDLPLGEGCLDNQGRAGECGCAGEGAICLVDLGAGPVPRAPTEASGDGVDNDCDGEVDER